MLEIPTRQPPHEHVGNYGGTGGRGSTGRISRKDGKIKEMGEWQADVSGLVGL